MKLGQIPEEVREKLEFIGQSIDYKLEFGTEPGTIIDSEDPLMSQLSKGFRVTHKHCFVKNLRMLLLDDTVTDKLKKTFLALSPLAMVGCSANIDLTSPSSRPSLRSSVKWTDRSRPASACHPTFSQQRLMSKLKTWENHLSLSCKHHLSKTSQPDLTENKVTERIQIK